VHGIGDQAPNETALGFMNEFIRALPQDSARLIVRGLQIALGVVWAAAAVQTCLAMSADAASDSFTDVVGYGLGVVGAVLVWRLHTTIHRGLLQLWRYTKAL